jgi:thiol-disulfide isomerase/thioredoxin
VTAGVFAYNRFYVNPHNNVTGDMANVNMNGGSDSVATIYFFNVNWCPHCINAKPEWDKFEANTDGKLINNYTVKCINKPCDDTDDPEIIILTQKFNIEHYPTIKMSKGGKIISFEGKITENSLNKFVNAMI